MAQINARDWIFEASEDPTIATPVWAQIGGLESFELNPAENEEVADTTTFASGGVYEGQVMQRGASLKVEGKVVRAGTTPDAGQAVVDALSVLVGEPSLGGVRFRHTADTDWTVWTAWVSKGSNSGGTNDKTTFSAQFNRSGPATTDAVV